MLVWALLLLLLPGVSSALPICTWPDDCGGGATTASHPSPLVITDPTNPMLYFDATDFTVASEPEMAWEAECADIFPPNLFISCDVFLRSTAVGLRVTPIEIKQTAGTDGMILDLVTPVYSQRKAGQANVGAKLGMVCTGADGSQECRHTLNARNGGTMTTWIEYNPIPATPTITTPSGADFSPGAINLPREATQTFTTAGKIAIDSTRNQIVYGDGTNRHVLEGEREQCIPVSGLDGTDSWSLWTNRRAVKITSFDCHCRAESGCGGTLATVEIQDRAGNAIGSETCGSGTGASTFTDVSADADGTLTAGEGLTFDTTNTPTDPDYMICFTYTMTQV